MTTGRLAVCAGFVALGCGAAVVHAAGSREETAGEPAVATLEDIFGPTGHRFQGAIGLLNLESSDTASNPATPGFGLAVDDVVVEWREYRLVDDDADCAASGACATLDVGQVNVFSGRTSLRLTVQDPTPYGPGAVAVNDCDDDGSFAGAVDDADCDDDGVEDVVVRLTSLAEPTGEIVALNRQGTSDAYGGEIAVSASFDSPGVLFIQAGAAPADAGSVVAPTVTAIYDDHEDGTGNPCRNDVDPAAQGEVRVATTFFIPAGSLRVINAVLSDDHDDDGFADANETVDMRITVRNPATGPVLHDITAQLSTNDSDIDCIIDSFASIGDLQPGQQVLGTDTFRFRVADVERSTIDEDLSATFNVTLSSDAFDAVVVPQTVTLDLDLDASGGSGPTSFVEDFEDGTLGAFTNQNLDQGLFSFAASNGYRCQYSDPDWMLSNGYGAVDDCFVGASVSQTDAVFWQNEDSRGFTGSRSLYYGVELGPELGFTTPLAVLDAVRLEQPVNLSAAQGVVSELSFKHQVSLVDSRSVNASPGRSADRIAMNLQLADADGNGVGDWIKLEPYLNIYDAQAEDNYFSCTFDPIDDGHTEDDFFDPTDPQRRLGPSTTCFPGFSYVYQGATSDPFHPANLGGADEGPALAGETGPGTWIESRVDLGRFRGRRVRIRWVGTALKVSTFETWESIFIFNPDPGDDGMWIDDVRITNTLATPAAVTVDTSVFVGTPCGETCGMVTASLDPRPAALAAPGRALELDAAASVADRCVDGTLQYRFGVDGDGDGALDIVIRSWTDDPMLVDSPFATTDYVVEVRCSTDPACSDSAAVTVAVACPGDHSDLLCGKAPASPGGDACVYTPGKNDSTETDLARVAFTAGGCTALHPPGCVPLDWGAATASTLVPAGMAVDHSTDAPGAGEVVGYLIKLDGAPSAAHCNSPDWGNESPVCVGCPERNARLGDP